MIFKRTAGRWSDRATRTTEILRGFANRLKRQQPQARFSLEMLEDRTVPTVYNVDTIQDISTTDGLVSLREAILAANSNTAVNEAPAGSPGLDTINFNIPGAGVHTISISSALPTITEALTINGYSQPGAQANTTPFGGATNATLLIEIDGSKFTIGTTDGLTLSAPNSTIQGLVINSFTGNGIFVTNGADNSKILGNYIGTNTAGTKDDGNNENGIFLLDASNITIGGDNPSDRNLISGNDIFGVDVAGSVATGNVIAGNFIGSNALANAPIPNSLHGIGLSGSVDGTIIGSTTAATSNLIFGNGTDGISIGANATNTLVQSNFIAFNGALGAGGGILDNGASGKFITNVIGQNNGNGIELGAASTNALIQANQIGNNANVTFANTLDGVRVDVGSSGHDIRSNVIGGNTQNGVNIQGTNVSLFGNLIGVTSAGAALPNGQDGVLISGTNNTIDGSTGLGFNVISGNLTNGIEFVGGVAASKNVVIGNIIGLDKTGTIAVGNGIEGISITNVGGIQIGRSDSGNLISGNKSEGIFITGANAINNVIQGNFIGTDLNGALGLGNVGSGINISGAGNTTIGGGGISEGNLISGNGSRGIVVSNAASAGTTIRGNIIGLNISTTGKLGNTDEGILLRNGATNVVIGGGVAAEANIIAGNSGSGIFITAAGTTNNRISGNFIGTNKSSAAGLGNGIDGIVIANGAAGNIIGTNSDGVTDATERNIISGNVAAGIDILNAGSTNNVVAGNYIGTNVTGTAALGNGTIGVSVFGGATNTRIGTNGDGIADALERNIISGNGTDGVDISGVGTDGTVVAGNYIGTDVNGLSQVANSKVGVVVFGGAVGTIIGTNGDGIADLAERNIISGNTQSGIIIADTGTKSTAIAGNYIGVDVSGNNKLGNGETGVSISLGASQTQVGTDSDGISDTLERNIISGNGMSGVTIRDVGSTNNTVMGNYIGTNATGTSAIGNVLAGARIIRGATNNIIGTNSDGVLDSGEGNLISGNIRFGVEILGEGSDNNIIAGNFIGTNATATAAIANFGGGVLIGDGSILVPPFAGTPESNVIGGIIPAARNIISGNLGTGVQIDGVGASTNRVIGNYIGTNANGTAAVSNFGNGVLISGGATKNFIGTDGDGLNDDKEGNLISGNFSNGVSIAGAGTSNNVVAGNLIGVDANAGFPIANTNGLIISGGATSNRIGTNADGVSDALERNILGGNSSNGLAIQDAGTSLNTVAGNYIGTNAASLNGIGNNSGITIFLGASNNIIGGIDAAASKSANVIARNFNIGVLLSGSGVNGNIIAGNRIGTDLSDTAAIGNGAQGIYIAGGAKNNLVGTNGNGIGDVAERNIISGNQGVGVYLSENNTSANVIAGNYIGVDSLGQSAALGNVSHGVFIDQGASGNFIGTNLDGNGDVNEGNLISANGGSGVLIDGSTTSGNFVRGNFVGTNAAGTADLGNVDSGVRIQGAPTNTIGGTTAPTRNLIAGNDGIGIFIGGSTASGNTIQRNLVGVDITGNNKLPNGTLAIQQQQILVNDAPGTLIGGDRTTSGNVISGGYGTGMSIFGANAVNNVVQGNFIGTNANGTAGQGNALNGLTVTGGSSGTKVGGPLANQGNIISANGANGLAIYGAGTKNTTVVGNLIGTDVTGSIGLGNAFSGIRMGDGTSFNPSEPGSAVNTTVGGSGPGERNVISGNSAAGIIIQGVGATGNSITNNIIGLNAAETATLGNVTDGIFVNDASNNSIFSNAISGNGQSGVVLTGANAHDNFVYTNSIGSDDTGTKAFGNNTFGVLISGGAHDNVIGGMLHGAFATGPSNFIVDNLAGVGITDPGTSKNSVLGNYIGTNDADQTGLGNVVGVVISQNADSNTIGDNAGGRNIIAGNLNDGIRLDNGATKNSVLGNFIGANEAGDKTLPNDVGIHILSNGNFIGGTTNAARNFISGNASHGILIEGTGATNNVIAGNEIGTRVGGTVAVPNGGSGIKLVLGASNNTIGGLLANQGNFIHFNSGNGVNVVDANSIGNAILGNSIDDNKLLGIDLGNDSITGNDANDPDVGPNTLQNFPVLTQATTAGPNITITGTFNSTANETFRIEFFSNPVGAPGGNGQGNTYLGFVNVTTDSLGNATFSATLAAVVANGEAISATATNATNNTSEFAANIAAAPAGITGGSVSGVKFNDLNGNGIFDGGEPGIAGFVIFLDANSNNTLDLGEISATTDANGLYTLTTTVDGNYSVREVQQAGFLQTTTNPAPLAVAGGAAFTNVNFGNFRLITISGQKFNDLNGDGVFQVGEPGLANFTIFIDANNNGTLDGGETSTVTAANGTYSFANVGPGSYTIREVQQNGFLQTTANPPVIVAASGTNVANVNFGNFQLVTISGQKFNDLNGNGTKDVDDLGVSLVTIFLDTNNNGALDSGETSVLTDNSGNYSFVNLAPGTYFVREIAPAGTVQTTTNPAAISVVSGANVPNVNFGNFRLFTISGTVYEDTDGDQVQDPSEPGQAGVIVYNDANGNAILDSGEANTATDGNGNYTLANLGPGVYRIREIPPVGFTQATPNPANLVGASGLNVSDIDFGNQQGTFLCPTGVFFDPNTNGNALFVCGTNFDDVFTLTLVNGGTQIHVVINSTDFGNFTTDVTRIYVKCHAGNDLVNIDPGIFIQTWQDGGTGNDTLQGGSGNDYLFGLDGNDSLIGNAGNDSIDGANGDDYVFGSAGDDFLFGGAGNDSMDGGDGSDGMDGGDGNDLMFGGTGNDFIYGSAGLDSIDGNDGDDGIDTGDGNDLAFGSAGNDMLFGFGGNDSLDAGVGLDSVDAGVGDDLIFGGDGEDLIFGQDGNDAIDGGEGADSIDAGAGNDLVFGGGGSDIVYCMAGNDSVDGGVGHDSVYGGEGNDIVFGRKGWDMLYGGTGDDSLDGGDSWDCVHGDEGNDVLFGGAGADSVLGGDGDDYIDGGVDNDTLIGGPGIDTIEGGGGVDYIDLTGQ